MNSYIRSACMIALLSLLFYTYPHAAAAAPAGEGWQTPPAIQSEVLNENRSYRVLLPASYAANPAAQYPLLLLLDGQQYGDMVAGNAAFLAKVGEIPEHVIVAVDSGNRMRDFTPTDSPYWEGDGGAPQFLAFLQKELLPQLEKDYRIDRPRVIWGHSLSGLFAMHTLYAAPGLFDAHLVNDGTLDWHDNISETLLHDYLKAGAKQPAFLYFNSSYLLPAEDPKLRWFETLANMLGKNAPASFRWIYEPMPTETHIGIPLLGGIHGLRTLYEGYLVPEPVMFQGFDAVLKHYASIKGRVGAPEQIPEPTLNYFGYLMLGQNTPEAIRAFELAVEQYPHSANAWDSLSDGYLEANRPQDALSATEKSIALAQQQDSENLDYYLEKRGKIQEKLK